MLDLEFKGGILDGRVVVISSVVLSSFSLVVLVWFWFIG